MGSKIKKQYKSKKNLLGNSPFIHDKYVTIKYLTTHTSVIPYVVFYVLSGLVVISIIQEI